MSELKPIDDLPGAQQKALFMILRLKQSAFRTSEIVEKLGGDNDGRSVGAVLGSLARNGYLEKVQGGRDKTWKLSAEADSATPSLQHRLAELKQYWR